MTTHYITRPDFAQELNIPLHTEEIIVLCLSVKRETLQRIPPIAKISCMDVYDHQLPGLNRPDIEFRSITITDISLHDALPPTELYIVMSTGFKNPLMQRFDCKGKNLMLENTIHGKFKDAGYILRTMYNFNKLLISAHVFKDIHNDIADTLANPDVIISLGFFKEFDIKLLDGIYIENLELCGHTEHLILRADVCLEIKNFYDDYNKFEEFAKLLHHRNIKSARKI